MKITAELVNGAQHDFKVKDHDHAKALLEAWRTTGWAVQDTHGKGDFWIPFHAVVRIQVPED